MLRLVVRQAEMHPEHRRLIAFASNVLRLVVRQAEMHPSLTLMVGLSSTVLRLVVRQAEMHLGHGIKCDTVSVLRLVVRQAEMHVSGRSLFWAFWSCFVLSLGKLKCTAEQVSRRFSFGVLRSVVRQDEMHGGDQGVSNNCASICRNKSQYRKSVRRLVVRQDDAPPQPNCQNNVP